MTEVEKLKAEIVRLRLRGKKRNEAIKAELKEGMRGKVIAHRYAISEAIVCRVRKELK